MERKNSVSRERESMLTTTNWLASTTGKGVAVAVGEGVGVADGSDVTVGLAVLGVVGLAVSSGEGLFLPMHSTVATTSANAIPPPTIAILKGCLSLTSHLPTEPDKSPNLPGVLE